MVAKSDQTIVVENNHYFPPESVNMDFLRESKHRSTCPWKGEARYYSLSAEGSESRNAAWTYPEPKEAAEHIRDHVAFWKDVEVVESRRGALSRPQQRSPSRLAFGTSL